MKHKIGLILKSLREYKKFAIITPIFMVIEAAIESALPFLMSIFLDAIIQLTSFDQILDSSKAQLFGIPVSPLVLIIGMVCLAFLSIASGILGGRFGAKASVGLATNLRSDIYKKVQTFSFANIDKFSASSLVTRMTTDVSNVQMAFQMCIRIVVRAPLMMIFSAVMAFVTGGPVAWIFIGLIPIMVVGLALIIKFAMAIFTKVFKRYDALNESVQENVTGIRVVKAYVREDFEKQKFNTASDNMSKDFTKAEKIVALNTPLLNTTIHLSNILVVTICSYMISKNTNITYIDNILDFGGGASIGQMSALLSYGIAILMNILMISMILVMLTMSLEAVRRIGEVLDEVPAIQNPEEPVFEVADGSVDFNHVNFKYKENAEKNTLTNIDLHIKSGQFVGILGSTGSGKTSVINLISRLYDVSYGQVLVGGRDIREYDLKTLRDAVSVVLQKNVLFSGTIAENLRWGNKNASDEELWNACNIAQATEFVTKFKDQLNTKIDQGGANVSGGQKQRLCIARAVLKQPKVLILDDSTSAVDTKTDKLIRKHLREDIPNTTKIVIAQRISSIEDADQIIILDNGEINAIGTHEELLKNNKIYQEVYYTQNRVGGTK